jgi:CYTH domain-containing protein
MKTTAEIEKRFLVTELSPDFPFAQCLVWSIEQGYIESSLVNKSRRVRIVDNALAELAKKLGKGAVREETEFMNLSLDAGHYLLDHWSDYRVSKDRYSKDKNKYGWTIDFFKSPLAGIIIAEKEFKSAEEIPLNLELPSWIGKGFDVTDILTTRQIAKMSENIKAPTSEDTLSNLRKWIEKKNSS